MKEIVERDKTVVKTKAKAKLLQNMAKALKTVTLKSSLLLPLRSPLGLQSLSSEHVPFPAWE